MQLISSAKNGVAALELRRQLDVSYPTAWILKHKISQAMHLVEQDRQLTGRIEMDDAYLGERSGGKPGRGSENKTPFVVAVQSLGGKPHRACRAAIPHRLEAVAEFCGAHVARPATIVSDGLACFVAPEQSGVHEPIVTGSGRASAQGERFHGVKIFLGNLKSALNGTYKAFRFNKCAHRYCAVPVPHQPPRRPYRLPRQVPCRRCRCTLYARALTAGAGEFLLIKNFFDRDQWSIPELA